MNRLRSQTELGGMRYDAAAKCWSESQQACKSCNRKEIRTYYYIIKHALCAQLAMQSALSM